MGAAIAGHYRTVLAPPRNVLWVLGINGAMMCLAWFGLPPAAEAWMFSMHGPLAFPVVLESWMLADTPATNVLGADFESARWLLENPTRLRRWLWARSIVLASLVGLPCALLAVAIGLSRREWISVLSVGALLMVLPLGVLPVSAWWGILLPYRPRSLRWRWQHRRSWLQQLRWLALVAAPYAVVPAVAAVLVAPTLAVSRLVSGGAGRLSQAGFAVGAALACVIAGLAAVVGVRVGERLLRWTRARLQLFVDDPERG